MKAFLRNKDNIEKLTCPHRQCSKTGSGSTITQNTFIILNSDGQLIDEKMVSLSQSTETFNFMSLSKTVKRPSDSKSLTLPVLQLPV